MSILARTLKGCTSELDIEFYVEGPPEAVEWAKHSGFPTCSMGRDVSVESEAAWISQSDADLFIIDLLHVDDDRLSLYTADTRPVVLFSDMGDDGRGCDLLIQPQKLSSPSSGTSDAELVGPQYFIVDPFYKDAWNKPRSIPQVASGLLISMGGEANPEAILLLSKAVAEFAERWETIDWVLGRCPDSIKSQLAALPANVTLHDFVDDMGSKLQRADLAIIAGGFIKFDAACCGTPSIIIAQYEHQEVLGRSFGTTNAALYLGHIKAIEKELIIDSVSRLQDDASRRTTLSQAGKKLVDGRGAERVAQRVLNLLQFTRTAVDNI